MSTVTAVSDSLTTGGQPDEDTASDRWIERIDVWAEKIGDAVNPILIKETRQALKSRQFVLTFSVLLVAALAWTVAGSLSLMPMIYTTPSAPRMLIGYYIVLAIPMLLVVPLAAYRSLEAEIDDGTLELLSITALSPWQIVLGKLASASLQMMLYLVALFPCVAYAYTLRGVDLPTIGLMMAVLITAAIALTIVALAFAPLARGRSGRITTLLVVLMVLMMAQYMIGTGVVFMIVYGNPLTVGWTAFLLITMVLLTFSIGHLLLTATAAQLTPESENRSSGIRWSILLLTTLVFACNAFAIEWIQEDRGQVLAVFFPSLLCLTGLWTFSGALMTAESATVTPRIQRELPGNFLSRLLLLFFTPGPATGLVFACLGIVLVMSASLIGIERMQSLGSVLRPTDFTMLQTLILAYASYLLVLLLCVRAIVAIVRIRNHPRVEIGLAALIAIAVLAALVPYAIGLHANDYRPFEYSGWQSTNWVWTMGQIVDGQSPAWVFEVSVFACVTATLVAIACVGRRALAMRTATPAAVLAEQQKGKL
ncbi:ABC transporter permease [Allorhodopirellula heiligendammensis]|uniref:ABC-2 family transporter protein n=1 Tax=Allorhodopirellula heiligendammensis TaxID=2714739 RepID=A0A5C6BXM8_9BACT|nr:ABC transporter permease [Allorhodopirellula heiligendammensis]TWU16628.1 ABC-2 family transporter protein [Allorhodopirellula heiligendammensis]